MTSLVLGGLALAGCAAAARVVIRQMPKARAAAQEAVKHFPKPPAGADGGAEGTAGGAQKAANNWFKQSYDEIFGSGHYKGGFEAKMSRAEAAKILGVSTTSSKDAVKKAHKRLMLINHPDRGGSAYMATKVNEAKAMLDQGK